MPPTASTAIDSSAATDWPAPSTLAAACRTLWLATLGLMTAYMQIRAPAHRLLLARRIAANLETLSEQDCFAADCRHRFARLAARWQARAAECVPVQDQPRGGAGRFQPV